LMETGIITETKVKKTREMELTSWVFATCNNNERILEPLLSRFIVLAVPEHNYEQFVHIAVTRLGKEDIDKYTAMFIAKKVWHDLGSKDVRDVVKVARLITNQEDISNIISMMQRYSKQDNVGGRL
jgi:holliday junction DNA helicase RuvB